MIGQPPQLHRAAVVRHAGFSLASLIVRAAPCTAPKVKGTRCVAAIRSSVSMATAAGCAPKLLLVSDLDNTMVDHKDSGNTALLDFGALWQSEYAANSLLVYSTGRSPELYKELKLKVPLITPDMVICSVGTEITSGASMEPDRGWEEFLNIGWNRDIVVEEAKKFVKLRFQSETEQRPHKVSFNVEKHDAPPIIASLEKAFQGRGLKTKIVYSGGYDLDILPEGAGKGKALEYLLTKKLEATPPSSTLACGDSGNDMELFTVPGVNGVIVGNAMEELVSWYDQQSSKEHVFRATERCAAGIMQAISHFSIGPSESPRSVLHHQSKSLSAPSTARAAVISFHLALEKVLRGRADANMLEGLLDDTFFWANSGPFPGTKESFLRAASSKSGSGKTAWLDNLEVQELGISNCLVRYDLCTESEGSRKWFQVTAAVRSQGGQTLLTHWHLSSDSGVALL